MGNESMYVDPKKKNVFRGLVTSIETRLPLYANPEQDSLVGQ